MIEERVASVMFEIEIDDTLRQLSEGCTLTPVVALVIALLVYKPNDGANLPGACVLF